MKRNLLLALSLGLVAQAWAVIPRSASAPEKLIDSPVGLMAPVWSPDGKQIAVTTDHFTGIYVANADGSSLKQVSKAPKAGYRMMWNGASVAAEAKDPSGTTLYAIMVSKPDKATELIAALNDYQGKMVINPALSPDGSKIAFQIVSQGMWVINTDGSGLKSLGAGSHPSWLPDGTGVVYTQVSDNGHEFTASKVLAIDVVSMRQVTLSNIPGIIPMTPAVSPDGKRVAFENAADASIYT
ncbi:MAG: hypothetical protein LIP02_11545, partial [Bacteroidales bacterium]|nr:hypothetical protein [Bacteroidales bacterium]